MGKRVISKVMGSALLLIGSVQAKEVHYYYTDPQGTVLAKADKNGNIISRYDYAPYGRAVSGVSTAGPGYTGHMNDPATGLIYMQARYYDPEVGRFLSVDPVGPVMGEIAYFNRFSYVGDNPISRVDPFGRYYCETKDGCEDFDKAYAKLKDAAGAYSSHSAEGKAFAAVLGYYGNKNSRNSDGNKIYIKQGATSTGNPAEISHNFVTGSDTVTFDFGQIKELGGSPVIEMAASVGHEGQHGVDDAARRKAGMSEDKNTVLSTERNAYRLQSYIYQGLNYNSPYGLWRSDWPAAEVEKRRDAAIERYGELSLRIWLGQ